MARALIDPQNSFLRNTIGMILFIPIVIVTTVIALPFAIFSKPSKLTASEVVEYLSEFINDKGGQWDWDNFISVEIADPALESIRARAAMVELPLNNEGRKVLRQLLSEAESIALKPH